MDRAQQIGLFRWRIVGEATDGSLSARLKACDSGGRSQTRAPRRPPSWQRRSSRAATVASHSAIIGTTRPENAERNIQHAEKGPLPPEVVKKISFAFEKAQAAAGGGWSGQT